MTGLRLAMLGLMLPLMGGCAIYPRAQNPLPGVFRVAVIDFTDKSNGAEGLDTEKITEIFASELQKIPSYEVVPVQEVREVLGPIRIDTNQPQLAFEVARAVHAQAVIVGAVTEFNSYYPHRLGLHCEMYAMVTGQPEAVVESPPAELDRSGGPLANLAGQSRDREAGRTDRAGSGHGHCNHKGAQGEGSCSRPRWFMKWRRTCESSETTKSASQGVDEESTVPLEPIRPGSTGGSKNQQEFSPSNMPTAGVQAPIRRVSNTTIEPPDVDSVEADSQDGEDWSPAYAMSESVEEPRGTAEEYFAGQIPAYQVSVKQAIDPIPVVEPWVIRHSRVFDSTNHGFTRKLKDYYYFQDDLRGGDWQGYVLRNEDFTRFACNRMIYEMLEAAGGDWVTLFGMRYAKPWEPWPPR